MGTVTIPASGGTDFNIYGTSAAADAYHLGTPNNAVWTALDADAKSRLLVQASRFIDRQRWTGTKVASDQPLEWPRSGVTDKNGFALSSSVVPVVFEEACYELALLLNTDTSILESASSGSNQKRVKAGSVEVEFFRSTEGYYPRLPQKIHEMIGMFLAGTSSSLAMPVQTGAGVEHYFHPDTTDDLPDPPVDYSDFGSV